MADVMFAGIGGQGVLTAGKMLIQIAAQDGKNICWTSEYSAEMRGGSALCRVVVEDGNVDIGSPYPDRLDVLCCMTEGAYDTYIDQVRDGGVVVINSSLFGEKGYPEGVRVYAIDTLAAAEEAGNARGANLALLGAMAKATDLIDVNKQELLDKCMNKKGKGNLDCFMAGYQKAEKIHG